MAITEGGTGLAGSPGATADTQLIYSLSGLTAGRCVVVEITLSDPTVTVSSWYDDSTGGPMTFFQRGDVTSGGIRKQTWSTDVTASQGGASFVKANLSGPSLAAGGLSEWAGAAALGGYTSTTGSGANPSIAASTQDANNVMIGGFALVGSTLPTSGTGTLDRTQTSGGSPAVTSAITNNTSASPASVTNGVTHGAGSWIASALELRSTVPAGNNSNQRLSMMGIG